MEENKPGLLKHVMTYGAIIGLILVVYNVLLYITGLTFNKGLGLVQYAVLIAGLYMGTKVYRDNVLGGFISYGHALGSGVLIALFVGIISVFFQYILLRFIDPGLVDKYMVILQEQFENSRFIPEDQVDLALEKSKESMTALWSIPVGVLTFTFFGFIISLITSAIVKRDPNPVA
jgi:hypothetical protein